VEGNRSTSQPRVGDQRIEQRSHRRWHKEVIVYIKLIRYSGYLIKKSYQKLKKERDNEKCLAKQPKEKEKIEDAYPSDPTQPERNSAKNLPEKPTA
jgi:hypothetical protein